MSINPARQLRHVYSADPYMNNSGLHEIFTLRRFSKISNFFCVSDKSMEVPRDHSMYDKLYKVRPVVEQMNRLFPLYYKGSGHQVIDESCIKMASRDSIRQYCKSKPGAKFAWKVWSRCDSKTPQNPYLLQFIPYLGKKNTKVSPYGLYFDVVNSLTKSIRGTNTRLYTDNTYSTVKLFTFLQKHSVFSTGTARCNTLGLHPYVKNPPKKVPRGTHRIFQDENNPNLTCAVWFDTKPVWFISTETDPRIVCSTLRRVSGQYEHVNQPLIANRYNLHFKSVDAFDFCRQNTNLPTRAIVLGVIFLIFVSRLLLSMLALSTWPTIKVLAIKCTPNVEFRLALGKRLIGSFTSRKTIPRVEPLFVGPDNKNEQFINHQNTRMPNCHSRVCKTHMTHFSKKQRTVYGCLSCNVHLCKKCHVKWHLP